VRGFHGELKRDRGTLKQLVFGIFERKGGVYAGIIPDCKKKKTAQSYFIGKVDITV